MTDAVPPAAQDPVSWAAKKKLHVNTRQSVRIPMASDVVDQLAQLEVDLQRASEADEWSNEPDTAPDIARQIQALEAEARASEVLFVFEGLGRRDYRKLVAEHPPTKEQVDEAAREDLVLPWNTDTFQPALMAASCVEPAELAGDAEEWAEIHDTWSNGPLTRLWQACNIANAGVSETPKSEAASAVLRNSKSS